MIPVQNQKVVLCVQPQTKDNGAYAGQAYVDTAGWGHVRFLFAVGPGDIASGSTLITTPPLIEECETTGGSYTAVTGAALAAAISASDDGNMRAIDIDLTKAHKRYMQVQSMVAGDGTAGGCLCVIAILSKPEVMPVTAAAMGLAELINA